MPRTVDYGLLKNSKLTLSKLNKEWLKVMAAPWKIYADREI